MLASFQTSLRVRQQRAVRECIMDAGIGLFLERGFGDTTVDMIALSSGVSRRTVFRHFKSKDDIVIAWSHLSVEALSAEVKSRPPEESPLACLCAALFGHVAAHPSKIPTALVIGRLIEETPSLRAYSADKYSVWEGVLAKALVDRANGDSTIGDVAPVAAAVAVGAFRVAARDWLRCNGSEPLPDLLRLRFLALNALGEVTLEL